MTTKTRHNAGPARKAPKTGGPARNARKTSFLRTVFGLIRDPLRAFADTAAASDGDITRINVGLFRPYLVTRPADVEHVLRTHATNYEREGMLWKPVRRVLGNGILGEGPRWRFSRRLMQPIFSAKNVANLVDAMAEASNDAVDDLARRADGQPVDALTEMTRVVYRLVGRVLFGDRISMPDAERLVDAIATAAVSVGPRLVLPFVPDSVRLPGDGAFRKAVRTVDDVVYPIVAGARDADTSGRDIVSILARARDERGNGLDDEALRDDIFSMFAAGTETTALAMTWLLVLINEHPEVADRMYAEIDDVVGTGGINATHLPRLTYTRMVIQEVLRIRPLIWFLPRTARRDDVIDGVPIPRGSTIVLSPYLTHRLESQWEKPDVFDPLRFEPAREGERHRYAYIPFGGGAHQCIGNHFFMTEALIIVASLLRRFRAVVSEPESVRPQAAVTLRPRERVELVLRPRQDEPVQVRPATGRGVRLRAAAPERRRAA